jgi:hypothetical protein
MIRGVVAIVVLIGISSFSFAIEFNNRLFILSADGQHLVVEGRWKSLNKKVSIEVPAANSVRIECDKSSGLCRESMAKLIRKSDDDQGHVNSEYLYAMVEEFKVIEWTDKLLTARAEPRAADIELRFSFSDQMVERTSRETAARGATNSNPKAINHWVLE